MGLQGEPGATASDMSRREVAEAWFRDEYEPVVEMLREAELIPKGVDATPRPT